ncbi:type II toxin-antitoxin system CcdA family antitoxin [Pollutimonas bauzanensis]|uniref:Antitoxin CcdA n=1 Tax=Pollutimonas bauzanensis TaxID=658167 RepID=A0A1M5NTE5_9BURK|nr:type II toxin-antitoxin system CcdA family antitoxin [Pollutimonas bauzanensis]SHG92728.1 antitoxin CcdA [Pollutimonas bauzanensis]
MVAPLVKNPPKRATNISLSLDVYNDAKALGINLSQTCERFLRVAIQEEKARQWGEQHAGFIEAYNVSVESEGLPLADWRSL